MKLNLTKLEKKWILYDVGNSAYTLMVSTLMPILFGLLTAKAHVSDSDYLAYWGYATTVATLLVVVLGPILGSFSDLQGKRRVLFVGVLGVGALGCVALGFSQSYMWFLVLYVLSKTAYSLSLVVYDAMLIDVTTEERMDEVSAHGFAWGYIGSVIPFLATLALSLFYEKLGITLELAMGLSFTLIAVWWVLMSIPLVKNYQQLHFVTGASHPVRSSFVRLGKIFGELKQQKHILLFLLAFFFYIDGVYTIIDMATAYGKSVGLGDQALLLALLVTQIVAFPSVIIFGRLSRTMATTKIIKICIAAYFGIAVFAIGLDTEVEFWILAVAVGLFQGTIQAMSRSYFAKIIPSEKAGEYFGVFDIFGKGASFTGTLLISVITQITKRQNIAIGALSLMFIVGFFIFGVAVKKNQERTNKSVA